MSAHKIPGVSKTICTAEQMIAYNHCWGHYTLKGGKDIAIMSVRNDPQLDKYDKDLICNLIETRFDDYCSLRYHILSSYEQVGKFFSI